jgi:hypothetical protein
MPQIEIKAVFFRPDRVDDLAANVTVAVKACFEDSQGLTWFAFEHATASSICVDVISAADSNLVTVWAPVIKHTRFLDFWKALEAGSDANGGPKRIPFQDAHAMWADSVRKIVTKHQVPGGWDKIEACGGHDFH